MERLFKGLMGAKLNPHKPRLKVNGFGGSH